MLILHILLGTEKFWWFFIEVKENRKVEMNSKGRFRFNVMWFYSKMSLLFLAMSLKDISFCITFLNSFLWNLQKIQKRRANNMVIIFEPNCMASYSDSPQLLFLHKLPSCVIFFSVYPLKLQPVSNNFFHN